MILLTHALSYTTGGYLNDQMYIVETLFSDIANINSESVIINLTGNPNITLFGSTEYGVETGGFNLTVTSSVDISSFVLFAAVDDSELSLRNVNLTLQLGERLRDNYYGITDSVDALKVHNCTFNIAANSANSPSDFTMLAQSVRNLNVSLITMVTNVAGSVYHGLVNSITGQSRITNATLNGIIRATQHANGIAESLSARLEISDIFFNQNITSFSSQTRSTVGFVRNIMAGGNLIIQNTTCNALADDNNSTSSYVVYQSNRGTVTATLRGNITGTWRNFTGDNQIDGITLQDFNDINVNNAFMQTLKGSGDEKYLFDGTTNFNNTRLTFERVEITGAQKFSLFNGLGVFYNITIQAPNITLTGATEASLLLMRTSQVTSFTNMIMKVNITASDAKASLFIGTSTHVVSVNNVSINETVLRGNNDVALLCVDQRQQTGINQLKVGNATWVFGRERVAGLVGTSNNVIQLENSVLEYAVVSESVNDAYAFIYNGGNSIQVDFSNNNTYLIRGIYNNTRCSGNTNRCNALPESVSVPEFSFNNSSREQSVNITGENKAQWCLLNDEWNYNTTTMTIDRQFTQQNYAGIFCQNPIFYNITVTGAMNATNWGYSGVITGYVPRETRMRFINISINMMTSLNYGAGLMGNVSGATTIEDSEIRGVFNATNQNTIAGVVNLVRAQVTLRNILVAAQFNSEQTRNCSALIDKMESGNLTCSGVTVNSSVSNNLNRVGVAIATGSARFAFSGTNNITVSGYHNSTSCPSYNNQTANNVCHRFTVQATAEIFTQVQPNVQFQYRSGSEGYTYASVTPSTWNLNSSKILYSGDYDRITGSFSFFNDRDTFYDVIIDGNIRKGGSHFAGLVAFSTRRTNVRNCQFSVNINSSAGSLEVGGFISVVTSGQVTFDSCRVSGTFTNVQQIGGFVNEIDNRQQVTISSSSFEGTITAREGAAAFVHRVNPNAQATLTNIRITGTSVTSNNYVAGVIARVQANANVTANRVDINLNKIHVVNQSPFGVFIAECIAGSRVEVRNYNSYSTSGIGYNLKAGLLIGNFHGQLIHSAITLRSAPRSAFGNCPLGIESRNTNVNGITCNSIETITMNNNDAYFSCFTPTEEARLNGWTQGYTHECTHNWFGEHRSFNNTKYNYNNYSSGLRGFTQTGITIWGVFPSQMTYFENIEVAGRIRQDSRYSFDGGVFIPFAHRNKNFVKCQATLTYEARHTHRSQLGAFAGFVSATVNFVNCSSNISFSGSRSQGEKRLGGFANHICNSRGRINLINCQNRDIPFYTDKQARLVAINEGTCRFRNLDFTVNNRIRATINPACFDVWWRNNNRCNNQHACKEE